MLKSNDNLETINWKADLQKDLHIKINEIDSEIDFLNNNGIKNDGLKIISNVEVLNKMKNSLLDAIDIINSN